MSASRVGWRRVQGQGAGVYRHAFSFAVGLEGALPVCEGGVAEADGRRLPLPLLGQRAGGWTWALCWGPPRDMVETQGPVNVVCVCETKPRDSRGPLCRWWREQGLPTRQALELRLSSSAPCSSVPPPPWTCWSTTNPQAVGREAWEQCQCPQVYQSEPPGTVLVVLPPSSPRATAGVLEAKGRSRVRACIHMLVHTHTRTCPPARVMTSSSPGVLKWPGLRWPRGYVRAAIRADSRPGHVLRPQRWPPGQERQWKVRAAMWPSMCGWTLL